jgi:pimeloyl-[acyl-carrier protein] methyl ester esterase
MLSGLVATLESRFAVTAVEANPAAPLLPGPASAGREPVVLVGWSLGGMLALEAAIASPDRVRGLLLVGTTPSFCVRTGFPHAVEAKAVRSLSVALRRDGRGAVARFLRECAAPLAPLPASAGQVSCTAADVDLLLAGLEYLRRRDLRARCPELRAPCRVLHGGEDRVVPVEAGAWLARSLPGAAFTESPGYGHDLPLRRPDLVLRELEKLVESTA